MHSDILSSQRSVLAVSAYPEFTYDSMTGRNLRSVNYKNFGRSKKSNNSQLCKLNLLSALVLVVWAWKLRSNFLPSLNRNPVFLLSPRTPKFRQRVFQNKLSIIRMKCLITQQKTKRNRSRWNLIAPLEAQWKVREPNRNPKIVDLNPTLPRVSVCIICQCLNEIRSGSRENSKSFRSRETSEINCKCWSALSRPR